MKKLILILTIITGAFISARAQTDKIYKHSGEVVEGSVIRVAEYTVIYKYANENAEQIISKYAIDKIVYGKSERTEKITDKVVVNGKNDWNKVVVFEDKSQIAGLVKGSDVRGKTSAINFNTPDAGDRKAEKKLKEDAAKKGCPFVLITDQTKIEYTENNLGGDQNIKKGIAYKYM
ncbi:MAG: hypothetical protein EOP46_15805 [Sphingobacteriaceae bacterium]|nr:MAG: hypothetical protein EOP46_15805 [Sphingobacteriaceae bacterium]